ncbi:glycosyltransferase [Synechococcus sp. BS55D]|uniref:glycosyltransferase n=1 Tax=Synechococcus sp. BS55D TaxID=2055943 RepID=UPI00103F6C17|nr:glycosyltransferase [Synechococcus sp. BS55D]TCD58140.1 mannosyltransferase [Synechococcus sp. BS55D]
MSHQPLLGQKILVTAYDLEQSEHRGIAVYSKALIRCLHEAGAEVWLLTEFYDLLKERGLRGLPRATRSMIRSARILSDLAHGQRGRQPTLWERKLALARKAKRWKDRFGVADKLIRRPRRYRARHLHSFRLDELYDSPYPRAERLGYLRHVTGIVSAPELFSATQLASRLRRQKPVEIDFQGFDALLTTCPLNLKPKNLPVFVQSVHDLIPLEFVAHNEDPLMFSHRLQACLPARRLFVSHSTARKFQAHISRVSPGDRRTSLATRHPEERVIVQPPSLRFPAWLTADPEQVADLKPVCHLLRPSIGSDTKLLQPFRYFLFNSSVEERKNLLFLAKAYAESDLYREGIKLCVTGKLKGDDYSRSLEDIVSHEPGIMLTGYVDESAKLDLYLNAMGLVSPSLVEGFGIPVLDGACLGMPTLASDCESHREIEALHDFNEHVLSLDTLDSREWAAAMQAIAGRHQHTWQEAASERRRRIGRYVAWHQTFFAQLEEDLCSVLS